MEPTSNPNPAVNRFFTVAQVLAFNQPPMPEALKKVAIGGGSKAEYLEGEYIRIALNMLVGQGMWELKTSLVSHDVRTIKKDIMKNGVKQGVEDWLGISAVIHTQLVISARDGSDAKLIYEATAVGNGMNHPDKGISDPLDKAIKSAETDTLKRCSLNLGRVFGLDLKNKITRNMLPLNVKHFEDMIAARQAQTRIGANDQAPATIEHAPQAIESRVQPAPAAATPTEVEPNDRSRPVEASPVEAAPVVPARAATAVEPETTQQSSAPKPTEAARSQAASDRKAEPPQTAAASEDPSKSDPQPTSAEKSEEPWELSLIPSGYDEWLRCIKTMAGRVAIMKDDNELDNFIRRHDKLIKKYPNFPASGEMPARNFIKRWATIVEKRREEFRVAREAKEQAEAGKQAA